MMFRVTKKFSISKSLNQKFLTNIQRNGTLKKEKKDILVVKRSWIPGDIEIRKKTWAARK